MSLDKHKSKKKNLLSYIFVFYFKICNIFRKNNPVESKNSNHENYTTCILILFRSKINIIISQKYVLYIC